MCLCLLVRNQNRLPQHKEARKYNYSPWLPAACGKEDTLNVTEGNLNRCRTCAGSKSELYFCRKKVIRLHTYILTLFLLHRLLLLPLVVAQYVAVRDMPQILLIVLGSYHQMESQILLWLIIALMLQTQPIF